MMTEADRLRRSKRAATTQAAPDRDESGLPDPREKARRIVEAALEMKCERPIVLDMRALTAYADSFVILTGRSDRQVRSIAEAIVHALREQGDPPLGVEGLDDGNWVLIDCNDAIVHVFDAETRLQFDLERLWRDAPRLDLEIEGVDPNPGQLEADDEPGDEDAPGRFDDASDDLADDGADDDFDDDFPGTGD